MKARHLVAAGEVGLKDPAGFHSPIERQLAIHYHHGGYLTRDLHQDFFVFQLEAHFVPRAPEPSF